MDPPGPDVQVSDEPSYEVDKILKWRKTKVGRRMMKEYLVTWRGYVTISSSACTNEPSGEDLCTGCVAVIEKVLKSGYEILIG